MSHSSSILICFRRLPALYMYPHQPQTSYKRRRVGQLGLLGDGDPCAGVFSYLLDCFTLSSDDSSTVAVIDQHPQRHITIRTHHPACACLHHNRPCKRLRTRTTAAATNDEIQGAEKMKNHPIRSTAQPGIFSTYCNVNPLMHKVAKMVT